MTDTSVRVEDVRAYAQGEIFLLTHTGEDMEALVYNSTGFGPCPAAEFAALDVQQLAAETGSDRVWKNPRRFWMMDAITVNLVGEPRQFGTIMFNLMAKMKMPRSFDLDQDQSANAYHPMQIHRVSKYEFLAGRTVQLLRSPDGVTWVMQTFTDHIDPTLTEDALPSLADKLTLHDGWEHRSVTLGKDLTITTNGLANIVSDNLSNMYQGLIDGVGNFDPWA